MTEDGNKEVVEGWIEWLLICSMKVQLEQVIPGFDLVLGHMNLKFLCLVGMLEVFDLDEKANSFQDYRTICSSGFVT